VSQLMEQILSHENMNQAYKKVKANKGAGGVDGISVDEVHTYLMKNWPSIKSVSEIESINHNLSFV
jgi:RNA-directed DNA polymerase